MNPLSLRATNFRTFESLALDLPAGCLAIVGPNGSGKSSIVNLVDLCLFGPESRSLGDYLAEDGATEMEIELVFEHAGEGYRVRRGFSAKGRGKSTHDFERRWERRWVGPDEEGWEPLSRESQKETQALVEQTIGLSRETFRASAFLAQGDGAAFSEAAPRERKAILASVLRLEAWERLLERCRADIRQAERSSQNLAGRIAFLDEQAGATPELEAERSRLHALVSELEREHASRQSELEAATAAEQALERAEAAYREQLALVAAAEARLGERRAVVDRAAQAKLEAVEVQATLADVGDPTPLLASLEKARADLGAQGERRREASHERALLVAEADELARQAQTLQAERERVLEVAEHLRREAVAMNDPASQARCDRCGQALHGEAFQTALRRVWAERDDVERRAAALLARIGEAGEREQAKRDYAAGLVLGDEPDANAYAELVGEIHRAREAELEAAGLRERLVGLERQIAEVTPALAAEVARLAAALVDQQAALAALAEPEPGALDAAREQAYELQGVVQALAAELTIARTELVRAESALERQHKIAEELHLARAEQEALLGELDLLATCERAYGRDGIPALIVEAQAIPQIEAEANRILAELGTSYRVELRTQRELKSSDALADTLDVVVIGEVGARPYETFSGGERTRINLALRIALARLLAHRRGADVQLLCVDEPEYLDEAGTARLAEVLRSLEDEFSRIVLVSHVPTLRDAFDQTLEVTKENGRSAVMVA